LKQDTETPIGEILG
jgi:hypothetical protein